MPDYLYLDIETIPTEDPIHIAEIAANVTHPAKMSKQETIDKWAMEQKPVEVAKAVSKTSFDGAYGQICCIGWAWNDGKIHTAHGSSHDYDEGGMINTIMCAADHHRPSQERPIIVGHFVAGFDIRFIWQRAFVLGVQIPHWFPHNPKPWSDSVNDTMAMWAGDRDTVSLDKLCKALGIDGKGDVSGADVAGMWQRKEFDAIAKYCEQDVEKVRKIHQKMLYSIGGEA